MTIRLYFIDLLTWTGGRYPAHFGLPSRGIPADPPLATVTERSMMEYGLIDVALIAADVTTDQHDYLVSLGTSEVLPVAENLDSVIPDASIAPIRAALRGKNIPALFVSSGDTYRLALREIAGVLQYMQRLTAIRQVNPLTLGLGGAMLDWRFNQLPAAWRTSMQQAALELELSTTGMSGASTLETILGSIATQSANRSYAFGTFTL